VSYASTFVDVLDTSDDASGTKAVPNWPCCFLSKAQLPKPRRRDPGNLRPGPDPV